MKRDELVLRYHEDADLFRAALTFTERDSGFGARLIEKDYYCSVILHGLAGAFEQGLVFRGGTCLSKVHTAFHRLSEDLDFVVATAIEASRSNRRTSFARFKRQFTELPERLPCFQMAEPLVGSNGCRQYAARYAYRSVVSGEHEHIKVEIGLREPILDPVDERAARTMLIDPFRTQPASEPVVVRVLSVRETYAEKLRAALTRRQAAIRDFYDINHALRAGLLDPANERLRELLRQKLAVPGNDPIDMTEQKEADLRNQLEPQLRPVLRQRDYSDFSFEHAFAIVAELARKIVHPES